MQHLEIERKFLLKSMPDKEPDEIVEIEQWYIKNSRGIWERARTWDSNTHGIKWIHTVKKAVSKGVNLEDEHDLTLEEFNTFKEKCLSTRTESRYIKKKRYIFKEGNLKWEVDKFENDYSLIIAEIEIPKKSFKIDVPYYISEILLLEVTGLKQFNNRNLSIRIK